MVKFMCGLFVGVFVGYCLGGMMAVTSLYDGDFSR